MELYYHVVHIDRKKKYVFDFCYIKLRKYVRGRVNVDLNDSGWVPYFDADSSPRLLEDEKRYIVESVLRHI